MTAPVVTDEPPAHAVARLAATQHGIITTQQARSLGATSAWLTRTAKRGFLEHVGPSLWRVVGAPETPRQRLLVAVLAGGPQAMADGSSSLGLWVPHELDLPPVPQVSVPRKRSYRLPGVEVTDRSDLRLAKPTVIDAIPTTGVARALLDVSAHEGVERVVELVDVCRRHLPMSDSALVDALHSHARPGRRGIEVFRQVVLAVQPTVSASEFERRVRRDLVAAGMPQPRLHHRVGLPGGGSIELDLDWPGVLLDVELDGRDHQLRMQQTEHDAWRDRQLQALGYQVIRFPWRHYVARPDEMLAEIAAFHATARRT